MESITKATGEDNIIYLTEETVNSESVKTTLTSLVTITDPSGNPETDVQTVTITITSTED